MAKQIIKALLTIQPHSLPVVSEKSQAGVSLTGLAERIDGICSANIFIQWSNLNIQMFVFTIIRKRIWTICCRDWRWHLNLPDLTWLGIRSTDSAGCTRSFMASNLWMLGTAISLHKKDDTKAWKQTFGKTECWWYTHRHDGQQPADHPNLRPPQSAGCYCHIYLSIGAVNEIFIILGENTFSPHFLT